MAFGRENLPRDLPRRPRQPGEKGSAVASPAWLYSDWVTLATGSTARLTRLRLHIQEVSDAISTGNVSNTKGSRDKDAIEKYLEKLHALEKTEVGASSASTGLGTSFTRARTI